MRYSDRSHPNDSVRFTITVKKTIEICEAYRIFVELLYWSCIHWKYHLKIITYLPPKSNSEEPKHILASSFIFTKSLPGW